MKLIYKYNENTKNGLKITWKLIKNKSIIKWNTNEWIYTYFYFLFFY